MSAQKYIAIFLSTLSMILGLSLILENLDIETSDNDSIRQYQFSKIHSLSTLSKNSLIIVGDSSGGNAVDANELSRLSGEGSANLSLTGSYGVVGSLNMIKLAHAKWGTTNFLIIHSLDIWHRDIDPQGIFKTTPNYELLTYSCLFKKNSYIEYLQYMVNPQRIYLIFNKLLDRHREEKHQFIDFQYDFLTQRDNTYANGKLKPLNYRIKNSISNDKKNELKLLDDYCHIEYLNCILISGPIHDDVYTKSRKSIDLIQQYLLTHTKRVKVSAEIFHFPSTDMGDTIDHVNHSVKPNVTRLFWSAYMAARS